MEMKYIMVKRGHLEIPIIFSKVCNHDEIADQLDMHVISAGFISISNDEKGNYSVRCYGESTSLKIKSRNGIDSRIVEVQLSL